MPDKKILTNRRGDKFNLTDNARRLLSGFLEIPDETASQSSSSNTIKDGAIMGNQELVDRLKKLIEKYNNIFRLCHDALSVSTPQAERDELRDSIKDLCDFSDTDTGSNSSTDDTVGKFENMIDSFVGQFRLCYHALEQGVEQAERDELRSAIAGFLDKK
jgi:hypothetical protein